MVGVCSRGTPVSSQRHGEYANCVSMGACLCTPPSTPGSLGKGSDLYTHHPVLDKAVERMNEGEILELVGKLIISLKGLYVHLFVVCVCVSSHHEVHG